jgi:type II secretion system protein N
MTPRRRTWLRILGYVALTLVVFLVTLQLTFPYDRLKDKIADALSEDYEVDIQSASPGWLLGDMTLEDITLTPRQAALPTAAPPAPGEKAAEAPKPTAIVIKRVDISIGILAALVGKQSIGIDAEIGEGTLEGKIVRSKDRLTLDLHTEGLALETVPGVGLVTGGAPIMGPIQADAHLTVPLAANKPKWREADGTIQIGCEGCTIGDGKTKVKPLVPNPSAFAGAGFTLPKIRLGAFSGRVELSKGVACFTKFGSNSADGELSLEGGLTLADPFKSSQAQLYVKMKFTDEFRKKEPENDTFASLICTGAKLPDGTCAFQANTQLQQLGGRWRPAMTPPAMLRECAGGKGEAPRVASNPRSTPSPGKKPTQATQPADPTLEPPGQTARVNPIERHRDPIDPVANPEPDPSHPEGMPPTPPIEGERVEERNDLPPQPPQPPEPEQPQPDQPPPADNPPPTEEVVNPPANPPGALTE